MSDNLRVWVTDNGPSLGSAQPLTPQKATGVMSQMAARIRTLEAANAQLAADNRVLAAEVRAWRGYYEWQYVEGGETIKDVFDRMTTVKCLTEQSGALERSKA